MPASTKKTAAKAKKPAASRKKTATPRKRKSALHGPFEGFTPYKPKRGEKYMNDAQKEHFRAILEAWKNELMEEVDRTVHHMQDEASNFPDPNDRATQESEFSLELRTRDRERKLTRKINESLEDIDSDDYGYCVACGVEIGIRRLEARPTATKCIDCKTLDEIRERQTTV
jgi:DnaK suppressor protein